MGFRDGNINDFVSFKNFPVQGPFLENKTVNFDCFELSVIYVRYVRTGCRRRIGDSALLVTAPGIVTGSVENFYFSGSCFITKSYQCGDDLGVCRSRLFRPSVPGDIRLDDNRIPPGYKTGDPPSALMAALVIPEGEGPSATAISTKSDAKTL